MKRTTLIHVLLAGVAISLLTACTKEEEVNELKSSMNKPESHVTYEADWVVDRVVIDNTKFDYEYTDAVSGVSVWHMPNQLLLKDVLPIDEWNIPANDRNELYFPLQNLGYNTSETTSFYKDIDYTDYNSVPGAFANDSYDRKYTIRNGEEVYSVYLDCKIDGTYEHDTDQWTMKWTVDKLKVYSFSVDAIIATHTFEPALTMMLISTKRL